MHFTFRNVNDAFYSLVQGFDGGHYNVKTCDSRNGPVLMIDEPVIVTYTHPQERVLRNPVRDCNPFFHLYESLWMLAGSNDVTQLAYYVKRMLDYSDDGKTQNGAYGYRWRKSGVAHSEDYAYTFTSIDQLNILIEHLKNKPESRRAVLQMWNVEDDLLKIDTSKDVCCNTSVYFSIRTEKTVSALGFVEHIYKDVQYLDMTVTNRSNDLVWGMLGANFVHFTMLQEYVADCLGVRVGKYHQITNNLHIYTSTNSGYTPKEWIAPYKTIWDTSHKEEFEPYLNSTEHIPLVNNKEVFDVEVQKFVESHGSSDGFNARQDYTEKFLRDIAWPMCRAYHWHKLKYDYTALECLQSVAHPVWRADAIEWICRRMKPIQEEN